MLYTSSKEIDKNTIIRNTIIRNTIIRNTIDRNTIDRSTIIRNTTNLSKTLYFDNANIFMFTAMTFIEATLQCL